MWWLLKPHLSLCQWDKNSETPWGTYVEFQYLSGLRCRFWEIKLALPNGQFLKKVLLSLQLNNLILIQAFHTRLVQQLVWVLPVRKWPDPGVPPTGKISGPDLLLLLRRQRPLTDKNPARHRRRSELDVQRTPSHRHRRHLVKHCSGFSGFNRFYRFL